MDSYLDNLENLGREINNKKEMADNYSICSNCGMPFEQGYVINQKTGEKKFNHYKYCEKCRKKTIKAREQKSTEVKIKYTPYKWQQDFHNSKARFKVISGAARTGKDRSCTMEFTSKFVNMLNEDRDYTFVPKVHGWIIAPTYRLAGQLLREIMNSFPSSLVTNYDKENYTIETVNGGLIEFRSADDPDSLVSVGLDIVWITEAARIKQFDIVIGNITDRLDSPGRGPNGSGGLLLVNSSPRGRTYFNEVCQWGVDGTPKKRPFWQTWYVSRWDNPEFAKKRYKYEDRSTGLWTRDTPERPGDRTYEEDLMLSRSDRQYNEDVLGRPSDQDGSQFPNFRQDAVIDKPNLSKEELKVYINKIHTPVPGYTYSIGYDPAKEVDGAWCVVYCENTGEVVQIEYFKNMKYTEQINVYIKQLVIKWNYAMVRYGKTGLGEALEDLFVMAGIATIPYPEQGQNKERLVENLTTLVKAGKFKVHNVDDISEILIRQFEDYIYSISPKAKTITYSNGTAGQHDDGVSASYFATADINVGGNIEDELTAYDASNNFALYENNNLKIAEASGGFF